MDGIFTRPRLNSAAECDEIEKGLYLGNLQSARDEKTLAEYKISHIVCAFIYPIDYPKHIKSLYIDVQDFDNEPIMTYFEQSNQFIGEGQKNGACLVHCFAGISRSSTLIIAFLMQKYQITFKEAMRRVKEKRYSACPNFGFRVQLEMYEAMRYTLNKHYQRYRLLLLQHVKNKVLTEQDYSVVSCYTSNLVTNIDGDKFKCKRCRKYLFSEANILRHNRGSSLDWKNDHLDQNLMTCAYDDVLFIELMSWMNDQVLRSSGDLFCPKCPVRLGSFTWSSHACHCGAFIQPSFKIVCSNVDRERTLLL